MLQQRMNEKNIPESEQNTMLTELAKKETEFIRFRRLRLTQNEFESVAIVGRGAFGEVRLVKMKGSGDYMAMKKLKKSEILKKEQVYHVRAERDIMARGRSDEMNNNPWAVKLYFAFQDEENLYLIMEYVPGGDLLHLLVEWDTFTEDQARFYIAETLLAIESIHQQDYIHRQVSATLWS